MPFTRGLLLLSLAGWVTCPALSAQDADPRALAERVLAREDCQTALPAAPGEGTGSAPGTGPSKRPGDRSPTDRPAERPGWTLGSGALLFGASFAQLLLWIVVVVAVASIVGLVLRGGRERRAAPPPLRPVGATPRAAAATAAPLQSPDADALAASGRFGAAVHALLHHALQLLAARPGAVRPSTTAREALRAAAELPGGAAPLRDLVHRAERWRFGGHSVDADGYAAARAAFELWEAACRPPR